MPKKLSLELIEKIRRLVEEGFSQEEIARTVKVSESSVGDYSAGLKKSNKRKPEIYEQKHNKIKNNKDITKLTKNQDEFLRRICSLRESRESDLSVITRMDESSYVSIFRDINGLDENPTATKEYFKLLKEKYAEKKTTNGKSY